MTIVNTQRTICGALLLLAAALMQAQDTLVVGTKTDGTPLEALCYTFPQRIDNFTLSERGDYLCLNFRESTKNRVKSKGELGLYDLLHRKLLWKQPFKFTNQEIQTLSEGVLARNYANNRIVLYDNVTGLERWKMDLFPVYLSDSLGILMGYSNATSQTLRIVQTKYGNKLWEFKVPHEHGWNEVFALGNGTNLIVADDLHKIDFVNGDMQVHEGKTGVYDTKTALLQGLAAVAGAGLMAFSGTGYYFIPTGKNVITGLASNLLVEDSCYFWADRNHIACLDTALNVIWQTPITQVKAASSQLFRQGDKLYLVNYGYGKAQGTRRKYGRPFIACYDANSGEELYFNRLSTKKDMIEGAMRTESALFLLFDDGMAYQSLADSIVNITPWNTDIDGKLVGMLPSFCYVANQDTTAFEQLVPEYGTCIVYNDQKEVFRVGTDLTISDRYRTEQIYLPVYTLQDYLCIVNNRTEDTWFIHNTGMPVAHLTVPFRKGRVAGNKLIMLSEENQLLFLDLDELR
ncbi:MAG: PQQ-like beta-propeller repeat protein [Prevotellaceae bacterium]|jgi:hypothetical protein|nr:PQQ-like beta-propeller repeat protein [Prevotellaceae bacterium]